MKVSFDTFQLESKLRHNIKAAGFVHCTPIQASSLPYSLKQRDVTGQAQTGTGKTAAFLIALIQNMLTRPARAQKRAAGTPRALILAPTRELAIQIGVDAKQLTADTGLKVCTLFGGEPIEKQARLLTEPIDIAVGTPGRLLDFCGRRMLFLGRVEVLVIDEADRMFSMGFMPDVRRLIRQTPGREKRHTMLFSATFSDDVLRLAEQCTVKAAHIALEPERPTAELVEQLIYMISGNEKLTLLYNLIRSHEQVRMLVFANRKDTARDLDAQLRALGVNSTLLSGEIKQQQRLLRLEQFKSGEIEVMVATDVAGRGIHVDNVTHVINYNLPEQPEDYIHRIGRTGRAGAVGMSISFACEDDGFRIPAIESTTNTSFNCTYPDKILMVPLPAYRKPPAAPKTRRPKRRSASRR